MPVSSIFRIYEGNSFLHRLDPRTKLILLGLISLLAVTFVKAGALFSLFIFVLIAHTMAKIPFSRSKYLYISYPFIFFFIAVGQGFFYWGAQLTPLFTVVSENGALFGLSIPGLSSLLKYFPGEVVFYKEGFMYGLVQACRSAALLTAGITLALTTHPIDLLYALRKFKLPYELCFLISMSLRFVPQVMDEIRENFRAQKARGFVLRKLPFKDKIAAAFQVCDTLIIRWIQGVRDMALAIDLRGFRLYPTRTFVNEKQFQPKDYIVLGFSALGLGLFFVSRII